MSVLDFREFISYPFYSEEVDGVFYLWPYTKPPITFRLEEIVEVNFTGYGDLWTPQMAISMPNLRRATFPEGLCYEVSVQKYFTILRARGVALSWA